MWLHKTWTLHSSPARALALTDIFLKNAALKNVCTLEARNSSKSIDATSSWINARCILCYQCFCPDSARRGQIFSIAFKCKVHAPSCPACRLAYSLRAPLMWGLVELFLTLLWPCPHVGCSDSGMWACLRAASRRDWPMQPRTSALLGPEGCRPSEPRRGAMFLRAQKLHQ